MAAIWWTSSTFEHCLLIPPVIAWLLWLRCPEARALTPVAWPPALIGVAAAALVWLVGDAAGVALLRHLSLVLTVQATAVACLGPAVARRFAFPLFYLLFLVPFGEELVPPLQTFTARMSMALLSLTGVPAQLDGVFITTPDGYFEVAEACSGVKFLVAMLAYGALVANTCFRGAWRRAAFMAAAVVVPILANGVRAWGTIYVATLTGADAAARFDHVFYGWIFFGVVIALLMAAGWRFFDRRPDDPFTAQPAQAEPRQPKSRATLPVLVAVLGLAALAPAWSALAAGAARPAISTDPGLPVVPGWRPVFTADRVPWRPRYEGADRFLLQRYVDGEGRAVDLAIAVFATQAEGREIVGYGQGATPPGSGWAWTASDAPIADGDAFRIVAPGPVARRVALFYRVGGVTTGSGWRAKLAAVGARLLGRSPVAVAVLVSAEESPATDARGSVEAFTRAAGPIGKFADRVAAPRPAS